MHSKGLRVAHSVAGSSQFLAPFCYLESESRLKKKGPGHGYAYGYGYGGGLFYIQGFVLQSMTAILPRLGLSGARVFSSYVYVYFYCLKYYLVFHRALV